MNIFFALLFLIMANNTFAQDTVVPPIQQKVLAAKEPFYNEIIEFPDEKPSYPDGTISMTEWFNSYIEYPRELYQYREEGEVLVSFIVEKNGKLTQIKVEGEIKGRSYMQYILSRMPRWTPGKVNDKPVRTRSKLRIVFALI